MSKFSFAVSRLNWLFFDEAPRYTAHISTASFFSLLCFYQLFTMFSNSGKPLPFLFRQFAHYEMECNISSMKSFTNAKPPLHSSQIRVHNQILNVILMKSQFSTCPVASNFLFNFTLPLSHSRKHHPTFTPLKTCFLSTQAFWFFLCALVHICFSFLSQCLLYFTEAVGCSRICFCIANIHRSTGILCSS